MRLPPLPALDVLDSLSRTGSVRDTAEAVHLSQSAVSHKLRALEDHLGFQLTVPRGRGIALTPEARRYVAAIAPALASLRAAHRDLAEVSGILDVAAPSGLAATWLAPRLRSFLHLHPQIDLTLRSVAVGETAPACDLHIDFTDMARGTPLVAVSFFPVCAPDLLHAGRLTLDQITPDQLLHLDTRDDWAHWLAQAGAPQDTTRGGLRFTGLLAMYAAAEAGLGLGLGDALTSARALETGRLVRPFDLEVPSGKGYVLREGQTLSPAAQALAQWLRAEIAPQHPGPLAIPTPLVSPARKGDFA